MLTTTTMMMMMMIMMTKKTTTMTWCKVATPGLIMTYDLSVAQGDVNEDAEG